MRQLNRHRPTEKTKKGFWFSVHGHVRSHPSPEVLNLRTFDEIIDELESLAFFTFKQATEMSLVGLDFPFKDLSGFSFHKCYFDSVEQKTRNVQFSNCLIEGYFENCDFTGCVFKEGVVFDNCEFWGCNFTGCSFGTDTLFIDTNFENKCILRNISWKFINCELIGFSDDIDFLQAYQGGAYFGETLDDHIDQLDPNFAIENELWGDFKEFSFPNTYKEWI